jgi:hypothetical protein
MMAKTVNVVLLLLAGAGTAVYAQTSGAGRMGTVETIKIHGSRCVCVSAAELRQFSESAVPGGVLHSRIRRNG